MEILFERILLRPWTLSDAPQLAKILNNKRITDNLRDGVPSPYSLKDAQDWLNLIMIENTPTKYFAITLDKQVIGSIGIVAKTDIYRKNVEIGFFLAENYWGRGIATKAIKKIISYAFNTFDIVRVQAEVFSDNIASRKALEKAGLKLEATFRNNIIKNGIIKDSCIYSVLEEDYKYLFP
jgi:ribosomal-protein-alanine N-acetyltransferase